MLQALMYKYRYYIIIVVIILLFYIFVILILKKKNQITTKLFKNNLNYNKEKLNIEFLV